MTAIIVLGNVVTATLLLLPSVAHAGNGANFVLYDHHTAEAGEMEVMVMHDFGAEPDGKRYTSQMVEFELGITDKWTSEFMIESQESGTGNYLFTGFRLENRYRFFKYGTFLNPVLYVEYEDLSEQTKYLMEVSGREDATEHIRARPRERVLETRFILGQDITDQIDVAFNWLNESDMDTGVTSFGYAVGIGYKPDFGGRGVKLAIEIYGGLGNSEDGFTVDGAVTQHYLAPNFMIPFGRWMVKFGGAVGLTNVSQDLVRLAIAYNFQS